MSGAREARAWVRNLGPQVVMLLSLALLPIGVIAVMQTMQVSAEAQRRSELALLALTDLAATEERQVIQRGLGAAQALGPFIALIRDDPPACQRYLSDFIDRSDRYSFVGFLPPDGQMTCSSAGRPFDFSDYPGFAELVADPRISVEVNTDAPLSGTSVLIVSHPVFEGRELAGYVSLSIPHHDIPPMAMQNAERAPLALITFNLSGDVLTYHQGVEAATAKLPAGRPLESLTGQGEFAFTGQSVDGEELVFAVVPVVDNSVYALGTWPVERFSVLSLPPAIATAAFPVMMWLGSVLVAYFALHRLVIRHIRTLRRRMQAFARSRAVPAASDRYDMPSELLDVEQDFINMAGAILHDEALLEDAVREKNVLLKEVHHRVKNNLQLISSIMNLQMRRSASSETRQVVKRLQERVLGLASIHRMLYGTNDLGRLNAGELLREIVGQMQQVAETPGDAVEVRVEADDIDLFPDQAVPLSLLVAEAATNALKYGGPGPDGRRWMNVRLAASGRKCLLAVENSVGPAEVAAPEEADVAVAASGLGTQLMRAFATQLGAELDIVEAEDRHVVTARFTAAEFSAEPADF